MSTLAKRQVDALRTLDEANLAFRWMKVAITVATLAWLAFVTGLVIALALGEVGRAETTVFILIFIGGTFSGAFGLARLVGDGVLPAYRRRRVALYVYQDILDESLGDL